MDVLITLSFMSSILSNHSDIKKHLGQVFTSRVLANFMVSLIKEKITEEKSILDPCIGPNTFFRSLQESNTTCYFKGIEVDTDLINTETRNFFKISKRSLIEGSFFDLEVSEKFDFIIQNPPYVRHELLSDGVNSKTSIRNYTFSDFPIPPQSNLYVYFLLKSILHLKENGTMVAVIYDSWLYSSFGSFLKESFAKQGYLSSIYHFKRSAFEDAEVGATVIKFVKTENPNKYTSYYTFTDLNDITRKTPKPIYIIQKELVNHTFNNLSSIDFNSSFFNSLHELVSQPIQRGTSAIVNEHFILKKPIYPESKPIIKGVSQVRSYSVKSEDAYILAINSSVSDATEQYLNAVKTSILNTPTNKLKAVKRNILNKPNSWYKVNLKSSTNFIFNYYLRKNINFIYNPDKYIASDNFYTINIDNQPFLYLAILNSSITKLSILGKSRSQGNGLRKIQLYEFKETKIININRISAESTKELSKLGELLLNLNRYGNIKNKTIRKIDCILLKEYNNNNNACIDIDEIMNELEAYN